MLLTQQWLVTAGTYKLTEYVTVTLGKISAVWKFYTDPTHIYVLELKQYSFTKILVETLYMERPRWCNSQCMSTFIIAHDTYFCNCRSHKKVLWVIVNVDRCYNVSGYIYYLSSHAVLWMDWIFFIITFR